LTKSFAGHLSAPFVLPFCRRVSAAELVGAFRASIRMGTVRRSVSLAGVIAAASLVLAASARADGDPASDVLFARSVFLPLAATVSRPLAARLEAATRAARTPIRVALIATPGDLGAVPSLFGQPAKYARFLGLELQFVYRGRLLVVMPQGAVLSQNGRVLESAAVSHVSVGPGADGLARAALALVGRPAEKSQKRAAPTAPAVKHRRASPAPTRPAPRSVGMWKATGISVATVVCLLLLGGVAVRRMRLRARVEPVSDPVPVRDDPYAYREPW